MENEAPHCPIPEHPTVLLLNSRPWLYSIGASTLKDVSDDQLSEALLDGNVDVVWLQGCWELGRYGRTHDLADPGRLQHFRDCLDDFSEADCIGSPYAISQYKCNPLLGSDEELRKFRSRLAARGVALMLDFVPNHMARDSPWIDQPGALFVKGEAEKVAYGRDPYSGDWTDTAQLNYWSEACRAHMLEQLFQVAEKCDAMRVDMAMLCVNDVIERTWGNQLRNQGYQRPKEEFWIWALPQVRNRHPNFFFMAECYEYDEILPSGTAKELLRQGFTAVYDKVLYDRLTDGHMDNLRSHIHHTASMPKGQLCHFTENHDEDRAAAHFGHRTLAATVISLTVPGPRLVMWGQERGLRNRLAVHLRRATAESLNEELAKSLTGLFGALPRCRGIWENSLHIHGDAAWRIVAWGWKGCSLPSGLVAIVVAVNFTDDEAWANIVLQPLLPQSASTDTMSLVDALTGQTFDRSFSELCSATGLVVGLKPFQSHVFLCRFK